MNTVAPIELTFYKSKYDDEILKIYSRNRVPSYLIDMAIGLKQDIEATDVQEQSDRIFDFVVEFYTTDNGPQFTRQEMKDHTDLGEAYTLFLSAIARSGSFAREFAKTNPQGPSGKKK